VLTDPAHPRITALMRACRGIHNAGYGWSEVATVEDDPDVC
jgi:hypothetical protein